MRAEDIKRRYAQVEDRRCQAYVEHKLEDVLILVQCAVMCGMDKLELIEEYGKNKQEWLKETFGIEKIPSDSTICRLLNLVKADVVVDCVVDIMLESAKPGLV
jgi:5'(3')-deoxyribonucleotidase